MAKERYENLDEIGVYAGIGIAMIHITDKIVNYCLIAVVTIISTAIIAFWWSKLQKRTQM